MKKEDIKSLALTCGFKLKPQPNGRDDLNSYVYIFAQALLAAAPTPPAQETESVSLVEFKEKIDQWAQAYPLDVFPEPDLKRANEVLKASGMNIDLISASSMRHVITRVKEMLDSATAHPQSNKGEQ